MLYKRMSLCVLTGLLTLSLTACFNSAQNLRMKVVSLDNLNPSDTQAALPVYLRVYQLRDTQAFERASYEALWKNDKQSLGDSVKSRQEYCILPNKTQTLTFLRAKEATHLGVLALYRDPKSENYKKILKIPGGVRPYPVVIKMQAYEIE